LEERCAVAAARSKGREGMGMGKEKIAYW